MKNKLNIIIIFTLLVIVIETIITVSSLTRATAITFELAQDSQSGYIKIDLDLYNKILKQKFQTSSSTTSTPPPPATDESATGEV